MTIVELRKKISESFLPDWYKTVKININYSQIDVKLELVGFSSIYDFILNQIDGWNKIVSLPNEFDQSKSFYTQIQMEMDRFIVNTINDDSTQSLENQWSRLKNQLNGNNNYFTFDSPKSVFLLQLYERNPSIFSGAYLYITGQYRASNKNEFIGSILAYEFESKGDTEIAKRISKEKKSISDLKSEFQNQINKTEQQLVEHLTQSSNQYAEYVKLIDNLKSEKELLFNDWFVTSLNNFNEFESESKTKILDLEKTYQEKLRLEKPAEYWRKRADELKKEGWKAIYWLIGLVAFACITLYILLWLTPEGMLLSFIKGDVQAIKWSIVYITFISFLAFGIKALNKVAFSSFHLARDSEEREQLTYFYLALKMDSSVDEKDRSLILQSLFSRAETGLLKDESGPTMPNDIAGRLIK